MEKLGKELNELSKKLGELMKNKDENANEIVKVDMRMVEIIKEMRKL